MFHAPANGWLVNWQREATTEGPPTPLSVSGDRSASRGPERRLPTARLIAGRPSFVQPSSGPANAIKPMRGGGRPDRARVLARKRRPGTCSRLVWPLLRDESQRPATRRAGERPAGYKGSGRITGRRRRRAGAK